MTASSRLLRCADHLLDRRRPDAAAVEEGSLLEAAANTVGSVVVGLAAVVTGWYARSALF